MDVLEGGPGSGIGYKNTAPIDLPMSDYISVGTRKGLQSNMDYDEYDIPLKSITRAGHKSYVPGKVNKFLQNKSWIRSKPIDVLWVRGDGYHIIDGHHRYLAASAMNIETLPARVYKKAEKTMPDYVADNPDKDFDMDRATRSTADAKNPGLINQDLMIGYVGAAEAMEAGDWDRAIGLFESGEWLRQKVKNPRTGRMVMVKSLPKELRSKYKPTKPGPDVREKPKTGKAIPINTKPVKSKGVSPDEFAANQAKAQAKRANDILKKTTQDWTYRKNAKGKGELVHKDGRILKVPKKANLGDLGVIATKGDEGATKDKVRGELDKIKAKLDEPIDVGKASDDVMAKFKADNEKKLAKKLAAIKAKSDKRMAAIKKKYADGKKKPGDIIEPKKKPKPTTPEGALISSLDLGEDESQTYTTRMGKKNYVFDIGSSLKMLDLLRKKNVSKEDATPSLINALAKKNRIKIAKYQAVDIAGRYVFPRTQKVLKIG